MPNRDKELVMEMKNVTLTMTTIPSPSNQYDRIIEKAKDIFMDRNKMYQDAFIRIGLIGNIAVLLGDIFRIKYMVYSKQDHGRSYKDNIKDKLQDIINQAVICIMVIDDNNYEGK